MISFLKFITIPFLTLLCGVLIVEMNFAAIALLGLLILFCLLFIFLKGDFNFFLFSVIIIYGMVISLGPINEMPIIFLLSPVLLLIIFFKIVIKNEQVVTWEIMPFFLALLILLVWVILGYIRNPIAYSLRNKLIFREYFLIIIGIIVFFTNLLYFRSKHIDENKFLYCIFLFCLIIGGLRILAYFYNFDIPLMRGGFTFEERGVRIGSEYVYRIGGIDTFCTIGVSAVIAYFFKQTKHLHKYLFILLFFIMAIAGGGRTLFFSLIFLLFINLFIFDKKELYPFIFILLLTLPLLILFSEHIPLFSQFNRIFEIERGFGDDPMRTTTYTYFWEVFLENPILGKGIGNYQVSVSSLDSNIRDFTYSQLMGGGHGAYLSALAIFGLGGLTYLILFLWGGILRSYDLIKNKILKGNDLGYLNKMVVFIFNCLVMTALGYVTGGSGWHSLILYYLIGMLSGILLRRRNMNMA